MDLLTEGLEVSETAIVREALLKGAGEGRLFRNNVGVLKDHLGHRVRFGLCVGSSDIIGWTPVVVTPEMVGRQVAIFTAYECKEEARLTAEQRAFLTIVQAAGGLGAVVYRLEDIAAAQRRFLDAL